MQAYLEQVTENFIRDPESALTGPLVRNDAGTIARNLGSLDDNPLQHVYRAFVNLYQAGAGSGPDRALKPLEQLA